MPDPAAATGGGHDHVAIEKAHAVIPSACVGLPAGNDATVAGEPTSCSAARKADPGVGAQVGDGLNSEKDSPQEPRRVASGGPACPADWALGVISAPRNSRGLPESRSRESRPTTRRPR